jgi:hypothetical protein
MPERHPSGAAQIAHSCATAAIVSELFPATKMAAKRLMVRFTEILKSRLTKLSGQRDTLVKMAVNSHFHRGPFDCPSASLYFSPSFKQF